MAINAQDMNDYCMEKLLNYAQNQYPQEKDNPRNMKVLAEAMQEYLEANLEATYNWSGT